VVCRIASNLQIKCNTKVISKWAWTGNWYVWTGMHHENGAYNFNLFRVFCLLQNTGTITDFNQNSRLWLKIEKHEPYLTPGVRVFTYKNKTINYKHVHNSFLSANWNSPHISMSFHSDTLCEFRAKNEHIYYLGNSQWRKQYLRKLPSYIYRLNFKNRNNGFIVQI
jgi:hypothetical protein